MSHTSAAFNPQVRELILFCPKCGMRLLLLAKGSEKVEPSGTEIQKDGFGLLGTISKLLKKSQEKVEPSSRFSRGVRVALYRSVLYYICGSCKTLLETYGFDHTEYNFKIRGTITDEILAMLIADSLKG